MSFSPPSLCVSDQLATARKRCRRMWILMMPPPLGICLLNCPRRGQRSNKQMKLELMLWGVGVGGRVLSCAVRCHLGAPLSSGDDLPRHRCSQTSAREPAWFGSIFAFLKVKERKASCATRRPLPIASVSTALLCRASRWKQTSLWTSSSPFSPLHFD